MPKATLKECRLIEDSGGRMWLDIAQLDRAGYGNPKNIDVIEVGGKEFLEVLGYSDKRKALWVQEVCIDGAAENIEKELYGELLGGSDAGTE